MHVNKAHRWKPSERGGGCVLFFPPFVTAVATSASFQANLCVRLLPLLTDASLTLHMPLSVHPLSTFYTPSRPHTHTPLCTSTYNHTNSSTSVICFLFFCFLFSKKKSSPLILVLVLYSTLFSTPLSLPIIHPFSCSFFFLGTVAVRSSLSLPPDSLLLPSL